MHYHWRPGGSRLRDPMVLDDQALILNVRGKGLVVLTGCGHAGIVNITRYARRLTGIGQVYAVRGGFHLGGLLFEPLIPLVCDELEQLAPAVIVPPSAPDGPLTGLLLSASRSVHPQHRRDQVRAVSAAPAQG